VVAVVAVPEKPYVGFEPVPPGQRLERPLERALAGDDELDVLTLIANEAGGLQERLETFHRYEAAHRPDDDIVGRQIQLVAELGGGPRRPDAADVNPVVYAAHFLGSEFLAQLRREILGDGHDPIDGPMVDGAIERFIDPHLGRANAAKR